MKNIEGKIRKIFDTVENSYFYDLEVLGETPDDSYDILSLTSPSHPETLVACEVSNEDPSGNGNQEQIEKAIIRARGSSGLSDLVMPKVLRFQDDNTDINNGFQSFLKSYKPAKAVYQSIFTGKPRESLHQKDLTFLGFQDEGGKLILLDNLNLIR